MTDRIKKASCFFNAGVLLLTMLVFDSTVTTAQCPDKKLLWNRIINLRDSIKPPLPDQLKELFPYVDKLKQCPDPEDSTLALLYQRIGAFHFLPGDFDGGIRYTKLSMKVIYDHLSSPSVNPAHLIKSYNNLRICYDSLGQKELRNASIDSSISLMVRLKTGYEYGIPLLYIRTRDFFEIGDYYKCIDYCNLGERVTREAGYGTADVFQYIIWRLNALQYLQQYSQLEVQLISAISEAEDKKAESYLGALYGLLARVYEEKGDETKTLKAANKAFYYDHKFENFNGCAATLNNVGYFLYFKKLGEFKKALEFQRRALKFADAMESLNIHDNIGNEFAAKKNYDTALYYYQKAFDQLKKGTNENTILIQPVSDFTDRNISDYIITLILDKAEAYLGKYESGKQINDIAEAKRIYKLADRILERMKDNQSESLSRIFWRSNSKRLYENGIKSCFLSGDMEYAFYFFERSRAVLLLDQLNEQKVLKNEDISRQYVLKAKINSLQKEINQLTPDSVKYASLYKMIIQEKLNLEQLDHQIKINNPVYFKSFQDTSMITLKAVREKILSGNDLLMEIFNGDSAVYSLFISPSKCSMKKMDKASYSLLTVKYFQYLEDRSLSQRDFPGFIKTSGELYSLLFKDTDNQFDRLIISPDGAYFPFESLVINNNNNQPSYLIEKSAISYTFSARYLLSDKVRRDSSIVNDFIGFAPVKYPGAFQLADLRGSDQSIKKIGRFFSSNDYYFDNKASKSQFFRDFYKYRIAQLYTHATNSGSDAEPVIYFADSLLLLSDLLYQHNPYTDLIVISACETAAGKLYPGEGVFSFSRGFAALGIPSSISNLWSVENESTYRLTELFYKYLAEGLPLDVALQKAKLEFLKTAPREKQLPYFWAAQILSGRTDPIPIQKPIPLPYILTGIVAGLFAIVMGWKWYSRKKSTPAPDKAETLS